MRLIMRRDEVQMKHAVSIRFKKARNTISVLGRKESLFVTKMIGIVF